MMIIKKHNKTLVKQNLIFCFFLLLSSSALAQKEQDVLYLRNGSIIRGNIIEKSDTLVRILITGGNVFAWHPDQILITAREAEPRRDLTVKEDGFFHLFTVGFLFGQSDSEKPAPFSVMWESFYKYRENYATGFFLGFEQLKENIVPMGISFKYMLPVRQSAIVFGVSGGYGNPVEEPREDYITRMKGGLIGGAELGFHVPVGRGNGIFMSVGYRYTELNYDIEDWWLGDYKRKIKYNRLLFRIGISFF